jgi:hypothetical protein
MDKLQICIMTTSFVLRRANTSRPSGDWSDDDYDVFADDQNVGRIFRAEAAHPDGRPWMWTIEFHQRRGEGPHQGHVASRDAAAAAFKAAWLAGVGKRPPWLVPECDWIDGRAVRRGRIETNEIPNDARLAPLRLAACSLE